MPREPRNPLRLDRLILNSGLELVCQPAPPDASSFSLTYVGPAGWGYDPPGHSGLASLVSELVVQGAGRRNRRELARLLDRFGGSLTSAVGPESSEVTLWGPTDAWASLLPVFADAVLRPRFDRGDIDRVRRQFRERQLRERTQPELRAGKELLAALYPSGHPYRSTGIGTSASLAGLNRDRLLRFHSTHFGPEGSVLAVTSPWGPGRIREEIDGHLGNWSRRTPPPDPPMPRQRTPARQRLDVAMNDHSQVEIRIGGPAISRGDPRYPALYLANEILGGRPLLSRLFQRVRERHGLVYHASSHLESMRWGGYWVVRAGTGPKNRERVVRLLTREIDRLSNDLVPTTELERIRESALGSLPLDLETTSDAHELAVEVAYHRLPTDFYQFWPQRLRAVRPAEVRAAAAEGLAGVDGIVVTAGPVREGVAGNAP